MTNILAAFGPIQRSPHLPRMWVTRAVSKLKCTTPFFLNSFNLKGFFPHSYEEGSPWSFRIQSITLEISIPYRVTTSPFWTCCGQGLALLKRRMIRGTRESRDFHSTFFFFLARKFDKRDIFTNNIHFGKRTCFGQKPEKNDKKQTYNCCWCFYREKNVSCPAQQELQWQLVLRTRYKYVTWSPHFFTFPWRTPKRTRSRCRHPPALGSSQSGCHERGGECVFVNGKHYFWSQKLHLGTCSVLFLTCIGKGA